MKEEILKKIAEVELEKKQAYDCAYYNGSMHPAYESNQAMYDYCLKKTQRASLEGHHERDQVHNDR